MRTLSQVEMDVHDDDLKNFEASGAAPLPTASDQGYVDHDGARIWYATYGSGSHVILLHGGLGHSGNWGYQVPMLVSSGYRALLIDSRGQGRSTRDSRPFTYELMASDVQGAIANAAKADDLAALIVATLKGLFMLPAEGRDPKEVDRQLRALERLIA